MATRVKLIKVNEAFKKVVDEIADTKKRALMVLKAATLAAVEAMMRNTPVWEGTTLRNYGIGIGRRGRRSGVEPVGGRAPKNRAARISDPGNTNKMALGAEPRRPANQSAAMSEINTGLRGMKKIENILIFNSSPAEDWNAIENARWPGGKGQRIRNRAVVSVLGAQAATELLRSAK